MSKKALAEFYYNNNLIDNINTINVSRISRTIRNSYTEVDREACPVVINQHLAYLWLADRVRWDEPINFTDLQDVHFTLFKYIHPDKDNGRIRTTDKKIRAYQCPSPTDINHQIDQFENLLILADDIIIYGEENANLFFWYVHNVFECIQPFAYGNGRIGRFLFNILRLRHGMGINTWNVSRIKYYNAIKKFEKIFRERYNVK